MRHVIFRDSLIEGCAVKTLLKTHPEPRCEFIQRTSDTVEHIESELRAAPKLCLNLEESSLFLHSENTKR